MLGVGRVHQGDRRLRDPRRAGAVRQRRPAREAPLLRAPPALVRVHARQPRAARPAADRPRRLERLPQPQLLLGDARRVVPDDRATATGGVAESVFIAGLFVLVGARVRGARRAPRRRRRGGALAASASRRWPRAVATHGWDGDWFLRAYDFFGNKVGSAANDEGQIFIEPQGCCVDGRHRPRGRARRRRRSTRSGSGSRRRTASCSSSPPYTTYHVELGEISSYPPGYKENARHLLPQQPVADHRRDGRRPRRPRVRLLQADQPVVPRGDLATSTAASRTSTRR